MVFITTNVEVRIFFLFPDAKNLPFFPFCCECVQLRMTHGKIHHSDEGRSYGISSKTSNLFSIPGNLPKWEKIRHMGPLAMGQIFAVERTFLEIIAPLP